MPFPSQMNCGDSHNVDWSIQIPHTTANCSKLSLWPWSDVVIAKCTLCVPKTLACCMVVQAHVPVCLRECAYVHCTDESAQSYQATIYIHAQQYQPNQYGRPMYNGDGRFTIGKYVLAYLGCIMTNLGNPYSHSKILQKYQSESIDVIPYWKLRLLSCTKNNLSFQSWETVYLQ